MIKSSVSFLVIILCVGLLSTAHTANQSLENTTLTEEEARTIVREIYNEHFNRDPDARGLELHVKLLLEEGKDAIWLEKVFRNSEEGRNVRKLKRQIRLGLTFVFLGSCGFLFLIWFLRKRKKAVWAPAVLYALWLVLFFESLTRLYFTAVLHVDFFHPEDAIPLMLLTDYVVSAEQQQPEMLKNYEGSRVLLLGASVLDPNHGGVPHQLRSHLDKLGADQIQIFNFARASHSTRDSHFKYVHLLKDYQFDAVVIYHAINDVRANNCPENVFRADYSHYAWYEDLNIAERHLKLARFSVLPYVGDLFYHRLRQKILPRRYIPTGEPSPDWIAHGAQLKTIPSFRDNLEVIIETARSRSTQVILVTFAYHVPPLYSRKAYEQKELDYLGRGYAIELWGEPSNVIRGVEAHNQVVRELAAQNSDVVLLDMNTILPKEGKYFADICHLSHEYGSKALAVPVAELLMKHCGQ